MIVLFDVYRILRAQQEVVDNNFSSQQATACNVEFPLSEELDMLLQRHANLPEVRAVQQSFVRNTSTDLSSDPRDHNSWSAA